MNWLLINLPETLLRTFLFLACFFCPLYEILDEVNVVVGLGFPDFLLFFRIDGRLEPLLCKIVSTASLDFDLFLLLLLFRVLWLVLGFAFRLHVFLCARFWFDWRSFGFYNAEFLRVLYLVFRFGGVSEHLCLLEMQGVVSCGVAVVDADIILLVFWVTINLLLHVLKDNDLEVLAAYCFEDATDHGLVIWPVFAREVVEHCTSVAVLFLQALLNHANEQVLLQVFVLGFIDLWLFFALLRLFSLL